MKRISVAFIAMLTLFGAAFADKPTAEAVLKAARTQAAQEHKNIFVMFDASW
jgi:hypothetical protein